MGNRLSGSLRFGHSTVVVPSLATDTVQMQKQKRSSRTQAGHQIPNAAEEVRNSGLVSSQIQILICSDQIELLRVRFEEPICAVGWLQECYRWVSDEFDAQAWEIYARIGAPKFVLTEGWTIFCQMLPRFQQSYLYTVNKVKIPHALEPPPIEINLMIGIF